MIHKIVQISVVFVGLRIARPKLTDLRTVLSSTLPSSLQLCHLTQLPRSTLPRPQRRYVQTAASIADPFRPASARPSNATTATPLCVKTVSRMRPGMPATRAFHSSSAMSVPYSVTLDRTVARKADAPTAGQGTEIPAARTAAAAPTAPVCLSGEK